MQITYDTKRSTVVHQYESAQELAKEGYAQREGTYFTRQVVTDGGWTGREFSSWDEALQHCQTSRPEDVKRISEFVEQLNKDLPTPVSIKRRRRFNEDGEGDVDVDRVMAGEPMFWNEAKRSPSPSCTVVSILCNMSISSRTDELAAFWKAAATIALADRLEAAGYSVEIRMYHLLSNNRNGKFPNDFMTCRIKDSGNEMVHSTVAGVMSTWFWRIFGITQTQGHGKTNTGHGYPNTGDCYTKFAEYLDLEGAMILSMPSINDRQGALMAANKMMQDVIERSSTRT